jgi:hypothetical protein
MVGAMSPLSRKLLRYSAPAAVFACGLALLATGRPAGFAWTLIVLSLGWAVQRADAIGTPSDRPPQERRHGGQHREPLEQRHLAESRRTLSGPR